MDTKIGCEKNFFKSFESENKNFIRRANQEKDSEHYRKMNLTDFSIRTILGEENETKIRKGNSTILQQFGGILDLSKSSNNNKISDGGIKMKGQYFPSYNGFYFQGYNLFSNAFQSSNNNNNNYNSNLTPSLNTIALNSRTDSIEDNNSCKDSIIKPKVLKPNIFVNSDRNSNNGKSNCNDCDGYFQNHFSNSIYSWMINQERKTIKNRTEIVQNIMMKSIVQKDIREDEFSFKCQTCDKVFGCATTLQSHEKTHKSPRYECTDCGKGFSQLRNYKYHLSIHRGTKEFAAECPECRKVFNDKGYLSSHMKIHRNKKEYECPFCPKSFNQRVAFNMHVRIHTGVKPHKCTECGKRFSRKMLLKQHMRTHSGEKPYQCSVCGKSFADRSNMTLHHRLHSGIKPFNCPICPKAFTKKHHLKTHLNYHTGCKPYVCPHPNCNQAFTQSSNMRTHAKKCQFRPVEIPSSLLPCS